MQIVQSSDYRSREAGISAITKANLRWTYAVVLAVAVKIGLIHFFSFLYISSSSNRHELVFDNSNKLLWLKGEARMYKIESGNVSEAQLTMSKISPTANYLIEKIYSVEKKSCDYK